MSNHRRRPLVVIAVIMATAAAASAQDPPVNASLVGHWDGFAGNYADVWADGDTAYVAEFGFPGVFIMDISDAGDPVPLHYILPPGLSDASAQDVKVANGLMFVSIESTTVSSVHIVDVRNPAAPAPLVDINIVGFGGIHNVFYDAGFLYMADSSTPRIGIIDLTTLDPDNPPAGPITSTTWTLQNVGTSFCHDMTVGGGRLYACAWNSGLWVYDVTNVATQSPPLLGSVGGTATHSCWPTDDGAYVVTGEERTGGGIQVYRITDTGGALTFQLTDSLSLPSGQANSVHNQAIDGYRLYNAWYQAGLQVHDIDPVTGLLTFVASYDTHVGAPTGFAGAWGIYPFLGENRILISDVQTGFYVLSLGPPLLSYEYPDGRPDFFDPAGDTLRVRIVESQPGALDAGTPTFHVDVDGNGFTAAALTPLGGDLYEAAIPPAACARNIRYYVSASVDGGTSSRDPFDAPAVSYSAVAALGETVFVAEDFEIGTGWTVENTLVDDGAWDTGPAVPAGSGDRGDPPFDFDGSGQCWLTDNVAGNSDLDGGPTRLISPVYDVTGIADAYVTYARWITSINGVVDQLDVEFSDDAGVSWMPVESAPAGAGWNVNSVRVADFVTPNDQLRIRFTVSDNPNDSITEAAIDAVRIVTFDCGGGIAEDIDMDGDVDIDDVVAVILAFGSCPGCPEDIDGNDVVDIDDVIAVILAFGFGS